MILNLLKKLIPLILSLLTFIYVLLYIPYPKSWPEASIFQILAFFLPILSFITFLINIIIYSLMRSFAIGLGTLVLLVLFTQNQLNLISTFFVSLVFGLIAWKIPQTSHPPKEKETPIPKLKNLKKT